MEGLGVGAAVGGGVGATLAAIFAVGSNVVVPGLGLVVAGPIAAALAGAGAGGATGGLVGALVGAGIPEERALDTSRGCVKEESSSVRGPVMLRTPPTSNVTTPRLEGRVSSAEEPRRRALGARCRALARGRHARAAAVSSSRCRDGCAISYRRQDNGYRLPFHVVQPLV